MAEVNKSFLVYCLDEVVGRDINLQLRNYQITNYKRTQIYSLAIIEDMSNIIKQGDVIPKLAKTKQLENPYQSNITASTQISRIFLLNDRNRVRLTQSSSDTESETEIKHQNGYGRLGQVYRGITFSQRTEWNEYQRKNCNEQYYPYQPDHQAKQVEYAIQTARMQAATQNNLYSPLNDKTKEKNKAARTPQFPPHKQNSQQIHALKTNTNIQAEAPRLNCFQNKISDKNPLFDCNMAGFVQEKLEESNEDKLKKIDFGTNNKISGQYSKSENITNQDEEKYPKPSLKYVQNKSEAKNQQQIAEQTLSDNFVNSLKVSTLKISIAHIGKPSLEQGSILKNINQGNCFSVKRGSIIDKIRQQNFMESKVINGESDGKGYDKTRKVTFQDTPKQRIRQNNHETHQKHRQRVKIFGESDKKQIRTPVKQSRNNQPSTKVQENKKSQEGSHNPNAMQFSPTSEFGVQNRNIPNGPYAICPHTQCIYKSLEIIDKLTNNRIYNQTQLKQKDFKLNSDQEDQICNLRMQIENEALDLSLRVDKLIVSLTISDLADQQTTVKIAKLKYEVENLLEKLKKWNVFQTKVGKQFSKSNTNKSLSLNGESRWELCEQFQKILKSLHYIQITQQRYKMWKLRLYHLSERIKHVHEEDESKQIMKSIDIGKHITQLEESKIYGQACSINVVESFNKYLDNERKQLTFTLQWIKESFIHKKQIKIK